MMSDPETTLQSPQPAAKAETDADTVVLTEEQQAARKNRNRAIALGLFAFVGLIFVTTMVRLATNYNMGG
ncbi:Protoheme IX farnesyltransferase [Oceanicaulis sp. 350]|nr:Protoheme IX farnesyltransferase [Oceanicaulis sp. 350]